ncbi:MAG: hypothetical protein QXH65_03770, partial [Thermofilaceae archaeon]
SRVETYMRVTGLQDRDLAARYMENAWRIAEYIYDNYREKVYLGLGLVYNPALVTLDEIAEAGRRVAAISEEIQVTVLDYFPAFRRRELRRPTVEEMLRVKEILEGQGLKTVIVQTSSGHVGPGQRRFGGL